MNKNKKIIANNLSVILLALCMLQCQFETGVKQNEGKVNRSVSEIGLEEIFAEDHVLVVSNTTDLYKEFTLEDFPEIQERCIKIEELTHGMTVLLRKQNEGRWDELQNHIEHSMLMNKDKFKRILRFKLAEKSKANVIDTIKILENRDDILSVEPDYAIEFTQSGFNQYTPFERISLPSAWAYETGSSEIFVGVVDTGIQADHPVLQGRVDAVLSRDFSHDDVSLISGQPSYPACGGPNGPWGLTDEYAPIGHGTFISGILIGNGYDITGVCWDVTLVSLKVGYGSDQYAFASYAVSAIDYAASVGIPILNMSFALDIYSFSLGWAIQYYPGIAVCSAGNNSTVSTIRDISVDPLYPASYSYSNLITVGATDSFYDVRANYSNISTGNGVDLFAPGDFWSITKDGGFDYGSGTSFSAPMVTGVCALIKSKYRNMRASEIKELILLSVDVKPALIGKCITSGRLNALLALNGSGLFGGGDGSSITPYEIWNEHQLANVYLAENKSFKIMDNIVLPYVVQPYSLPNTPIPKFSGYLDGNNKTISNLYIQYGDSPRIGLFELNTGIIINLNIQGFVGITNGNIYAGMISGTNYGTIDSCTVTYGYGAYVVSSSNPSSCIGGITGINYNPGIIQNCIVNGDIYSIGTKGSFAGINSFGTIALNNVHNGQLLP